MSNEANTENQTAAAKFFLGYQDNKNKLQAYQTLELFQADFGAEATPITSAAELEASDVPLSAIHNAYNGIAQKKVGGFKDRKIGSKTLFDTLTEMVEKMAAQANQSETEKLASALKPVKEKKVKKEKAEGESAGRSSPLSGKFWSRSGNALSGRRLNGSGVGIQALQYIINNLGCSTEDYIANSGGGRFVDLQYDLDHDNIVMLGGQTAEERQKEIAELAEKRKGAEKAETERLNKIEAERKAKKEKAEADKLEREAKKKADAEAKAAKEAEEAAKAEAAKTEGEQAQA